MATQQRSTGLPSRPEPTRVHSRFVEPPMYEYTPAHSIASEEDDREEYSPNHQDNRDDHRPFRFRLFLRALNAGLHFGACALLVTIMALFLAHNHNQHHHRHRHRRTEPQAIALIILLAVDIVVDIATFFRLRAVHVHISIVLVHLVLGLAYLTVFMVDVGVGSVFSGGYTFWGLPSNMAGPVVYFFLWVLGVWDLLHTVLHRHQVGRAGSLRGGWWLRRRGRSTEEILTTQAVAMRPPMRPGQGLPPVGSAPTTVTAPPNVLAAATARGGGQSLPEDKRALSSYASSASMSTQATRVEQGNVQPGKEA